MVFVGITVRVYLLTDITSDTKPERQKMNPALDYYALHLIVFFLLSHNPL